MMHVEVSTLVRAPKEIVADVYAEYPNWPHLFPTIQGVRLIRREGAKLVLEIDHVEGKVINELMVRSAGESDLREVKRRYDARFLNRFETVPGGTRFTVSGDFSFKGLAKLLRPYLRRYVRRQMTRWQLRPVKAEAELRARHAAEGSMAMATAEPASHGRDDAAGDTKMSPIGPTRRIFLVVLAALLGVAAGLGALIGAAAITARPPRFLVAGFAAFCAVYLLGLLLATRGIAPSRRSRARAIACGAGTAAVVGAFAATALLPLRDPRLPPAPVRGQRFWELPTGSRIAYVRVPAEGPARPTPVLFLHGGPGVPDMAGDTEYFGRLARDGFDVYVYDQVGTGRSARLADPRGYTLERDVADLEAIRRAIGAERVVLVGHSYGGALAAAYAAAHGEHVASMVLSSPDDPSPTAGTMSMVPRLTTREKLGVYALLVTPRPLLAYALLQVNPNAAHAFAGDAELDARQDRVYNRMRPALHCRGKPPGRELHGLGFFANQFPHSASRPLRPDFLPALAARPVPTLIIKGRCDYLTWSSAVAYLNALPDAQFVYLKGSGHNAYQDEPERYLAAVRAFLLDRPLPEPAYAGSQPPDDYEGPP